MSPYSGLVSMFDNKKLLVKDGNSLRYDFLDGTSIKQFRKEWEKNTNGCLDMLMLDFSTRPTVKFEADSELDNINENEIIDYDTGEIIINTNVTDGE
jgi:hypothetical protein